MPHNVPTREQLIAWDIRRAWRRGYVDGFQVALLAMEGKCDPHHWAELSKWVHEELVRWRFGPINEDNPPPATPGCFEPQQLDETCQPKTD